MGNVPILINTLHTIVSGVNTLTVASGDLPPRLLPPSGEGDRPAPDAPLIRGMPTGPYAFLGNAGRVSATALRPDQPKKGLVPHLPVRCGEQQIPQYCLW